MSIYRNSFGVNAIINLNKIGLIVNTVNIKKLNHYHQLHSIVVPAQVGDGAA